ncbi:tRNA uridine-5-carboxymethylaminomethyl(34) synthesis GTPase MnmE [candidate division KSB1 bacterium]|nr:tRNA uridine-5-carboxymethylaminomethyl(34) synthesis GTPase MnmE [candidate division KSB1 bacterium]
MNSILSDDTIIAQATPGGFGALAVIRISGPRAFPVADALLQGNKPVSSQESHRVFLSSILDKQDQLVDRVLVTTFRAPRSYTGQDTVEISCHGSPYIVSLVLQAGVEAGARPAEPGEFTRRAFVNGKIDLLQAEAINDLIRAQTESTYRLSLRQTQGWLSKNLQDLRNELLRQCVLLELELDFTEEDLAFADRKTIADHIQKLKDQIDSILSGYRNGRLLREGIRTAIVGRPNVGKSSLLNRLLEHERAIVSIYPGTTRDILEEPIDIDGVLFRLIDTAGLRRCEDPVERIGVERTGVAMDSADFWLPLIDSSEPLTEDDLRLLDSTAEKRRKTLVVLNKCDLVADPSILPQIENRSLPFVRISAKTGEGISSLKQALSNWAPSLAGLKEEIPISRVRHRHALQECQKALERAQLSLSNRLSAEFIALDLRQALDALAEMTGETTSDDILDAIFAQFCVGK